MKFQPVFPLVLVVTPWLIGCGGSESPAPQAIAATPQTSAPNDPIAAVAYDFMDAVFANDIARATQRLTPRAIQNLQAQDKRFEWGAAAAKLETGEVRVENDEAVVECLVVETDDASSDAKQLLCFLRMISGQWRVYGLAEADPNGGEPQAVNFEQLPPTPPQQNVPAIGNRYVETPAPQIPAYPADSAAQAVAEQPVGALR